MHCNQETKPACHVMEEAEMGGYQMLQVTGLDAHVALGILQRLPQAGCLQVAGSIQCGT